MKRSLYAMISIFAVAVACAFCACTLPQEDKTPVQLEAPQNVKIVDNELMWDEVQYAEKYIVSVKDEEKTVTKNFYYIPNFDYSDQTVKVKALGNGEEYLDSDWAEYNYVKEKPVEQPTAALKYTLLEDGSGYEVTRKNKDVNAGLEGRVVIPDYYKGLPVKKIADEAFVLHALNVDPDTGKGCNTVTTSFRLPAYLESIGGLAFSYCISITAIEIPDGVTYIGAAAFAGCTKLTKINIPSELTEIPNSVLASTAISQINVPDKVTSIGAQAFLRCDNLTSANIPDSVTYIGSAAFSECKNLASIIIPDSVTYVGSLAFNACENLIEFNVPANIQYFGYDVFTGTPWYNSQPDGFVIIRGDILHSYKGKMSEGTVIDASTLPSQVRYIAGGAFRSQKGVVSAIIPDNIQIIGDYVFYGCTSLNAVKLPSATEVIYSFMFGRCLNLQSIDIPDNVKVIEQSAFDSSGLKTAVIPKTVTNIDINAFACGIKTVYYKGTKEQWEAIEFGSTSVPKDVDIYYFSETEPTEAGNFWHYVDGIPVVWNKED